MSRPSNYSLKKIAEIVYSEKRKHDYIVALFQLYLQNLGVPRENILVMQEFKGLQPDLIWLHNGFAVIVFEIMDPEVNIRDPSIRRRYEHLIIYPYIQFIRPWYVVLTDGLSLYIYSHEFRLVYQKDNLLELSPEEEMVIRKTLFLS